MIEKVGRYEILDEIGEGGFAIVYRARDTELDRPVALKELRPVLLNDKNWVKRFHREAKTIARLDHPHIVTIHDVYDINNRLFIVMRLVDGPSLDEVIARQGRLPWPEATEIITAVAKGLDHAHDRDILHRDLKPANILMDPERGPMLTDFGLAKLASESSMSMTASGGVVGTPHYIAPEVWEGQGTTQQSDIYALGCILCEMLTGEKIFKGETPPAVMMAHFKPPALPKVWPEGVPIGVTDVVRTALASKLADRYAAVREMAEALTSLPEAGLEPGQLETIELAPEIGDRQADGADIAPPEQQDSEVAATPAPEKTAEEIPSEKPPAREAPPARFDFQKLEATIAHLSPQWRGFLRLASWYVIIVGMLGIINLLTSGYPWFVWPALALGVPLAIRLMNIFFAERLTNSSPKWRSFSKFAGWYVIIIGTLGLMNLLTSRYPWFLWPALALAIPLAIWFVNTLFGEEKPVDSPPTVAQPVPPPLPDSTALAGQRKRRSECLLLSVAAVVGAVLLVVIGVGGFCSAFGVLLNTLPTVEVGATETEDIRVPWPDSSDTPNLALKFTGGQFVLTPGAEVGLVEGTATYNVAQLKPQVIIDGSDVRIQPAGEVGFGSLATEDIRNEWDLKLGTAPLELAIEAGAADANIELGGLSLLDLSITQGAANFNLSFTEPNQVEMETLQFQGGASSATLSGLANARARDITVEAGAGDYTLDFSGVLQNEIKVSVKGGLGSITIIVPENVAAQVSASGGLSNVDVGGAWQQSGGNEYVLPGAGRQAGESHQITIETDIGLGNLELRTP
jgi:serine/threonine protein kinase